ncbi:acyl transferase 4-like [Dioscorea cayenensis subsp. rotundata]|uniref:Acyl transferase 4-like n=1 Tax=Dioscorea cayennensis subsp. rotundata TaxID=55577 RepID=A0AB40D244_DIOCR|nr:acyl transferase 4-like [Dioscorea cayenensis subsp. rotundata]XP_039146390.1 acyl transferase 4-like [Dioscorea cayenensis subsp. rotundata]
MSYAVSKLSQGLVVPAEATPGGSLALSDLDQMPLIRCMVPSMHVFKHGPWDAANVIRTALSKALVLYYPLAGKFVEDHKTGEVRVDCTGDGAWFIEASANCSLEDVNYLEHPFAIPSQALLPDSRPHIDIDDLIVLMQVTRFTCGGLVIGIRTSHTMADGKGAAQFFRAVAELARGMDRPSIMPVWSRELVRRRVERAPAGPPQDLPSKRLEYMIIDVPTEHVNKLKQQYLNETCKPCSTFEVLIATVWQCRTRAIGLPPNALTKLSFAANFLHLLTPALPAEGGYYGNCFYVLKAKATSEMVANASIVELVKIIKETKGKLAEGFAKWVKGEDEEEGDDDCYDTLNATDWRHLGFNDVDYGWGKAARIVPFEHTDFMPFCVLGLPPAKENSVRLMTYCVLKEHYAAFRDQMISLA